LISGTKNEFENQNLRIASFLLQDLSSVYTVVPNVVTNNKSYLLNYSPNPSVILECGYLSNEKDRKFISNPAHQQQIAGELLRAVERLFFKGSGSI
jgi:N-acetylmuramoyl-L-alanine amidase